MLCSVRDVLLTQSLWTSKRMRFKNQTMPLQLRILIKLSQLWNELREDAQYGFEISSIGYPGYVITI